MHALALLSALFFGIVAALVARQKGRNEVLWFLAGLVFQVFGLVVFFLSPVCRKGLMKKCPACAEIIRAEANVCRYCGREFPAANEVEVA